MSAKLIELVLGVALVLAFGLTGKAFSAEPVLPDRSHLSQGTFTQVAFDRNETHLVTTTGELAERWDLNTGELLTRYPGHQAPIQTVCFSPDGRHLLTGAGKTAVHGADDPTLRLWEVSTGKQVTTFTTVGKDLVDDIGKSHAYRVSTARYSPTAQQILAVITSQNSYPDAALLWNYEIKEIDLVLPHISTSAGSLVIDEPIQFSPDGKTLLGITQAATQITAWDASTGYVLWQIDLAPREEQGTEPEQVEIIQWSPSGKYLLAATNAPAIYVWKSSHQQLVQRLALHAGPIRVAQFYADDSQAITSSDDGSVKLWDTHSGKVLQQFNYAGPVQQASVSSDGQRLLTRTLKTDPSPFRNRWFGELRNLKTGESISKWELPPLWVAENQPLNAYRSPTFTPSGRFVLTTMWQEGKVTTALLSAATGEIKRQF